MHATCGGWWNMVHVSCRGRSWAAVEQHYLLWAWCRVSAHRSMCAACPGRWYSVYVVCRGQDSMATAGSQTRNRGCDTRSRKFASEHTCICFCRTSSMWSVYQPRRTMESSAMSRGEGLGGITQPKGQRQAQYLAPGKRHTDQMVVYLGCPISWLTRCRSQGHYLGAPATHEGDSGSSPYQVARPCSRVDGHGGRRMNLHSCSCRSTSTRMSKSLITAR